MSPALAGGFFFLPLSHPGKPLEFLTLKYVCSEEFACNEGDLVQSLGWEDPLEKGKATHSSILAWRIPWIV